MDTMRPFRLPGDIDLMVHLIREGFRYPENPGWDVQDDETESMIDQLRGVRRVWPLLRLAQWLSPVARDALLGLIHLSDGRPVGLVNFSRRRDAPEWTIGNVTVLPDHRRRGIARRLVRAALEVLEQRGARAAFLEVISANLPAVQLYEDLGFVTYARLSHYNHTGELRGDAPCLPPCCTLTKINRFDWRRRMDFIGRITPAEILRYEPLDEERFRPSPMVRILGPVLDGIGGMRSEYFAVETRSGRTLALGSYSVRTRPGGLNQAEVDLDPALPALAGFTALYILAEIQRAAPGRRIEIQVKDWQPALAAAFESLGCTKRCTLNEMGNLFESTNNTNGHE